MSKAPEHYKPFNIEQAKAGAPFGCKNGAKPTVSLWRHDAMIGYVEGDGYACAMAWDNNGDAKRDEWGRDFDLVMLPLGMCEGKPVFVGDKLHSLHDGEIYEAQIGWYREMDASIWQWPRPEPEYPKTRFTENERREKLVSAFPEKAFFQCIDTTNAALDRGTEALATAAIARAIQDGDVVPVGMLEKVASLVYDLHGCCECIGFEVKEKHIASIIKRVKAGEV